MEKVELSKEYLEKIAGYEAINFDAPEDYVPNVFSDLPKEKQPVFKIVGLDALAMQNVLKEVGDDGYNAITKNKATASQTYNWTMAVAKNGVVGWSNYYDRNGRLIAYNKECRGLPYVLLIELATKVLTSGKLSDDEELG